MSDPILMQHHGTCDFCETKHVIVTHYNYHDQANGFRLCEGCRTLSRHRLQSVGVVDD